MVVGGLGRDEQPLGDLGVGEALVQELEHLHLAGGEAGLPTRVASGFLTSCQPFEGLVVVWLERGPST